MWQNIVLSAERLLSNARSVERTLKLPSNLSILAAASEKDLSELSLLLNNPADVAKWLEARAPKEYELMSRKALVQLAMQRGVTRYYALDKDELIRELYTYDRTITPDPSRGRDQAEEVGPSNGVPESGTPQRLDTDPDRCVRRLQESQAPATG